MALYVTRIVLVLEWKWKMFHDEYMRENCESKIYIYLILQLLPEVLSFK